MCQFFHMLSRDILIFFLIGLAIQIKTFVVKSTIVRYKMTAIIEDLATPVFL